MGKKNPPKLRIATTSSIRDSGLMESLRGGFCRWGGPEMEISPVGTGQALEMGRRGDVDAVITHERSRELQFIEAGHGVNRREFMTNDFVLAGPPGDPAGVARLDDIFDALEKIYADGAPFISRADDSGTNLREIELWAAAALLPFGRPWYAASPGGMVKCLEEAAGRGAYTLADSGTFLSLEERLPLKILCRGGRHLRNAYCVTAINPARHPKTAYEAAMALITFLTGAAGQGLIRDFRKGPHPLFYPVWKPATHETQEPATHETQEPATHETQEPATHETQEPATHETQEPATHETREPATHETRESSPAGKTQEPGEGGEALGEGEPEPRKGGRFGLVR